MTPVQRCAVARHAEHVEGRGGSVCSGGVQKLCGAYPIRHRTQYCRVLWFISNKLLSPKAGKGFRCLKNLKLRLLDSSKSIALIYYLVRRVRGERGTL